jgi:quaternary ammonium compound-resistance protein SugE
MAWIVLFIAGLFEIAWAVGLVYTKGFTRLWPSVFTIFAMIMSVVLLEQAIRKGLPLGISYAIWTGIGAAGTAILGMVLFKESAALARLACLTLVIIGVVGLKFTHRDAPAAASEPPTSDKAQ